MKTELKSKWIEALRGGQYQQGRWTLRPQDHTYCCLGVLCDLINPAGWRHDEFDKHAHEVSFAGDGPIASIGLERRDVRAVVEMNDTGKSFDEIADYIEANVAAD